MNTRNNTAFVSLSHGMDTQHGTRFASGVRPFSYRITDYTKKSWDLTLPRRGGFYFHPLL